MSPEILSLPLIRAACACRRLTQYGLSSENGRGLTEDYPKRVKTLEAFYGSTAWHTENALRVAPVMADQTARRAFG